MRSSLETIAIASGDRCAIFRSDEVIEAPNWSHTAPELIYNDGGRLYRIGLGSGAKPTVIDTGFAVRCNNDHGISPDGARIVISDQTENGRSIVYTLSHGGGHETRLTTTPGLDDGPDYSPDGRYIYFNSGRTGTMQIWRMQADGSAQTRITSDGFNDWFPHPSPDGRWIAFLYRSSGTASGWHCCNRDR